MENLELTENRQATIEASVAYRTPYKGCPICGQSVVRVVCDADCRNYPNWHPPLPEFLRWLNCNRCGHIFTDSYYTPAGLEELFKQSHQGQVAGKSIDALRTLWAPVVDRVLRYLPQGERAYGTDKLTWLDVGCGAGGLVFTADEYGFDAIGLDLRAEAVQAIQKLGYRAAQSDLLNIKMERPLHVISMADVLEHTPYPVTILKRAYDLLAPDGLLYISCPNHDCCSWKDMNARRANPYWVEIEHHHNFSRESLMQILRSCGFVIAGYGVSNRYISCMEVFALKAPTHS